MPKRTGEECIYQYITRMAEQFPELPYIFQNEFTQEQEIASMFFSVMNLLFISEKNWRWN
ncbi:hypothetical protein NSQ14_09710 [Caldifermentibacillus hisashii]|uniref:hypothetical protein n=1 Tax=Caldifermentibacillus hisashii TaxID=996558 RepID=UPI0031FC89B8